MSQDSGELSFATSPVNKRWFSSPFHPLSCPTRADNKDTVAARRLLSHARLSKDQDKCHHKMPRHAPACALPPLAGVWLRRYVLLTALLLWRVPLSTSRSKRVRVLYAPRPTFAHLER